MQKLIVGARNDFQDGGALKPFDDQFAPGLTMGSCQTGIVHVLENGCRKLVRVFRIDKDSGLAVDNDIDDSWDSCSDKGQLHCRTLEQAVGKSFVMGEKRQGGH